MKLWKGPVVAVALSMLAGPATAQDALPSGQALVLWEIVWERVSSGDTQAVLRFIAPQIARDGGTVDAATALADLDWLCRTHGVAVAALPAARSDKVVVTLMDRAVPRGTTDAAATQYFGLYTIENGECSPEDY